MSLLTTRLGLKKPQDSDTFLVSDFDDNYDLIDSYPGVFICTSGTKPSWGASQTGQMIFCTDIRTVYEWTGSAFREPLVSPAGWVISKTLNADISPPTLAASITSYTLGTFTSSRACAALITAELEFTPPTQEYSCSVGFSLKLNNVNLTTFGGMFAQQGLTPGSVSSTSQASSPSSVMGFATGNVSTGTNTLVMTVTVSDNTSSGVNNFSTDVNLPAAAAAVVAINSSTQ